ncbi:MAG: hypothetical protein OHK0032_19310 [Thermodesulfovibrionales bacterium]
MPARVYRISPDEARRLLEKNRDLRDALEYSMQAEINSLDLYMKISRMLDDTFAVADVYRNWYDLSDDEVMDILER